MKNQELKEKEPERLFFLSALRLWGRFTRFKGSKSGSEAFFNPLTLIFYGEYLA
ncbi:MAG: hypothetical protein LUF68_08455 [Clostridiales bacterium]|nr:hypothetical protein [Clostridiales bacterium]